MTVLPVDADGKEIEKDLIQCWEILNNDTGSPTKFLTSRDYLEKVIKEEGRVGYKVNTFRVYKENNNQKKEFVYESYYPPKDKIILSGTKAKKIKRNIKKELNTDFVLN